MIVRQLSVYIMVGIISALIDVGLMQIMLFFGIHYLVAATFGFIVGLLVNFFLHSRITFKGDYAHSMFARYMVVVFFNYALTLSVVQVFNSLLDMPILGKILSLPLVAINGFFLSKYWIYKTTQTPTSTLKDVD